MTALFVHGVPETTAVWQPLVEHLDRDDIVALGLPGFGSALPPGFDPTMSTYAEWFAEQLTGFDEVDLVAHDWGAILSLRVLADRPANVRSWVSDMGDLSADFTWHDTAKIWQTPGDGEAFMDGMLGASLTDRAAVLMAVGVPESGATTMAEGFDATMGAAILRLYRSAVDVGNEWGPGIDAIEAPGLLLESMQDPFRAADRVERLARRTGAAVVSLPDEGHFWMLESPEKVARVLTDFWASV